MRGSEWRRIFHALDKVEIMRSVLATAIGYLACLATGWLPMSGPLPAQSAPSGTIKLAVGFTPGGPVDTLARIMADALAPRLKQAVVVENQPGANGITAFNALARAKPDGTTLNFISVSTLVAFHFQGVPLDFDKSATALGGTFESAFVVVVNPTKIPVKSMRELVAYLKANPGTPYATGGGIGTQGQLFMESLARAEGFQARIVPYPGGARAIQDLVGGDIGLMTGDMVTAMPQIEAGKIIPLAVTSPKRWPTLPNVPTMAEAGLPGQDATSLGGIVGPPNMPADSVARLSAAIKDALADPAVQGRIRAGGYEPTHLDPQAFRADLIKTHCRWGKVIAETGIKP